MIWLDHTQENAAPRIWICQKHKRQGKRIGDTIRKCAKCREIVQGTGEAKLKWWQGELDGGGGDR